MMRPPPASGISLKYLHSKLTGDAVSRGGRTPRDGVVSRSASAISSTSAGREAAHIFICAARGSFTKLITNSRVSRILFGVSFCDPSALGVKPITTTGGAFPIALKKLKGAAFAFPSALRLVTKAIGRGRIVDDNNL